MNMSPEAKYIRELVDSYLSLNISADEFCDGFYFLYILRKKDILLTNEENAAFQNIAEVSSRFSMFEEDHALDKNAFYTEKELFNTVTMNRFW